jgi:hypothetical protein
MPSLTSFFIPGRKAASKNAPILSETWRSNTSAVMVVFFYSSQIVYFGAEFPQVYASRDSARIEPTANAEANPTDNKLSHLHLYVARHLPVSFG